MLAETSYSWEVQPSNAGEGLSKYHPGPLGWGFGTELTTPAQSKH